MDKAEAQASVRFGLGIAPGQRPGPDPAAWLLAQLARPEPGPAGPSIAEAIGAVMADRQTRRDNKEGAAGAPATLGREMVQAETAALLAHAATTTTPFHERLVGFWCNHFTVSTRKGEIAPGIGAYVREAIRPHVAGRFADMLLAVMRHPAMLAYLDNNGSAGPRSGAGLRQNRGLNENLARECLELHTLSPAGGYTQADVTEFARVLTGWSVELRDAPLGFRFRPFFHEPGAKTVLGQTVPEGEAGGVQLLAYLANHPATHRHLATKLVRHFVADVPPPAAVRRIEATLRDTRGDLGAAAAALVRLPEAWQPLTKVRAPQDVIVATMRATGLLPGPRFNPAGIAAGLGQSIFGAPLPNGWPDAAGEWAGPEAMMRRIDWAYGFAGRNDIPEPMVLADAAIGPLLSDGTAEAVRRAGSRRDAVTLLLASPEFQRR